MSYPELNATEGYIKKMADSGHGGAVSLNDDPGEDKALAVRFYSDWIKNEEASKKAGRLVTDPVEYCEIRIPGSPDIIRNIVTDRERNRFPRQYAAFKACTDQDIASGTPLRDWPLMTSGLVAEAAYFGVRTVEGLSEISDGGLQKLGPGWLDLRKQAKNWLHKAKDGALEARLQAENSALSARVETLEKMLTKQAEELRSGVVLSPTAPQDPLVKQLLEQVQALSAAVAAKPAEAPKRRGRPPKAKSPEA